MVCEPLSRNRGRRLTLVAGFAALLTVVAAPCSAQDPATIQRIKPSIVAVGTFERTRNPQFTFSGTGFAVGDGSLVATNEHVLPKILDGERIETIAIAMRTASDTVEVRRATKFAADPSADLALIKVEGAPLAALRLGDSGAVREGELYLFTGFPIGGVLGLFPVTHRAMVASITPIVIPAARADQLDARSVRRLQAGSFKIFQLDGTAYPGNSGSPVYGPHSGEVIGVVNSVFVKGTKEAALTAPSGITYAIPAERLKALLQASQ
jgi:S1-C subfamily serine protease